MNHDEVLTRFWGISAFSNMFGHDEILLIAYNLE